MNKELYYIPTIEEFHIGFTYEVYNPEYEGDDTYSIIENASRLTIEQVLNTWKHFSEYKVKYLDKEDIESLEWKYSSQNDINNLISFKKDSYQLITMDNKLTIYKLIEPELEVCLFHGIINNKSELKFIMKCLEILE